GEGREGRCQLRRPVMYAHERAIDADLLRRAGQLDGLDEGVARGARLGAGSRLPVAEGEKGDALHRGTLGSAAARPCGRAGAAVSASPVAVAPVAICESIARRTAVWSVVGASAASGVLEKATTPTRTLAGMWSRNASAARRAATRRVGCTSSAAIDPEWSSTSTTEACRTTTLRVTSGRASATASAAAASSSAAIGT